MIEKLTVESLLGHIKSGIGLDIAKNHSGITIWDGNVVSTYGFALSDYDKSDYYAEYRMRLELKNKLKEIVQGKYFEYCIIEDVYGGENFDTARKLIALNTVIDELIFDGICKVDNFYRWLESTWMKSCRLIYKQQGKLKSKYEVQGILEYLGWNYYLEHKDDKASIKKEIYFEDICDSCGMLLGVVAQKFVESKNVKSTIRISNIEFKYLASKEDAKKSRSKRLKSEEALEVSLDLTHLEDSIVNACTQYPDKVLCANVPSEKLGVFGMKHNFDYFYGDGSYLFFYVKGKVKSN